MNYLEAETTDLQKIYTYAIKNGGTGAHSEYPNNSTNKFSLPAGKYFNSYVAGVRTVVAAEKLSDSRTDACL